jgi:hypothetical protein
MNFGRQACVQSVRPPRRLLLRKQKPGAAPARLIWIKFCGWGEADYSV